VDRGRDVLRKVNDLDLLLPGAVRPPRHLGERQNGELHAGSVGDLKGVGHPTGGAVTGQFLASGEVSVHEGDVLATIRHVAGEEDEVPELH